MVHDPIADIRDPEGQLIAALTVRGAACEPTVATPQGVGGLLLRRHLLPRALEDQGTSRHAIQRETLHLRHVHALEAALELLPAGGARLQHLRELELEVVDQAHAGRCSPLRLEIVEETYT